LLRRFLPISFEPIGNFRAVSPKINNHLAQFTKYHGRISSRKPLREQ